MHYLNLIKIFYFFSAEGIQLIYVDAKIINNRSGDNSIEWNDYVTIIRNSSKDYNDKNLRFRIDGTNLQGKCTFLQVIALSGEANFQRRRCYETAKYLCVRPIGKGVSFSLLCFTSLKIHLILL